MIALGAAIENVVIAASAEGRRSDVEYFPEHQNPNTVARITFDFGVAADPLAAVLNRRCTNRRPYKTTPIAPETLASLETLRFPLISLSWIHEQSRLKTLGRTISRADRLIFENQSIHAHLFSTIRWNQSDIEQTGDGLPIESLELGKLGSTAFRILKNWRLVRLLNCLGLSKAAAANTVDLMTRCSAAGLLCAPDTTAKSFLETGRAFQRLWLSATHAGLALQPMTAIIFLQLKSRLGIYDGLNQKQSQLVDQLRDDLSDFFDLDHQRVPGMLFRLGFGTAPSGRTIRRSVESSIAI
jgi:hypothetical protein